jgi:hypothetical protein
MSVVSFNGVNTNVDIESVHLQEKALAPYPDQQAATRKDPDAVKTAREQADAPVSAIRLMLYTGARHSEINCQVGRIPSQLRAPLLVIACAFHQSKKEASRRAQSERARCRPRAHA